MSARKSCWVECDYCPADDRAQVPPDMSAPSVAAARSFAKGEGWVRRNGEDICPECQSVSTEERR